MPTKLSIKRKKSLTDEEAHELATFQAVLSKLGYSGINAYISALNPLSAHRSIQYWKQQAQEGNPWHLRIVSAVLARRLQG